MNHSYFKPVILGFSLFVLFQLATGSLLYIEKIGLHPAQTLEFYKGSEIMRKTYPERPDRFKAPRSLEGLIKSSVAHFCVFGVIIFILAHFLRSLTGARGNGGWVNRLSLLLFLLGGLDIISGFLVRFGPAWTAMLRTVIFLLFVFTGITSLVLLVILTLKTREEESNLYE